MSHHGRDPFDPERDPRRDAERLKEMRKLLDTASFRGAIGDFPHGKLTKSDEGSIQFAVGQKDGKVVVEFGTPVAWIGMTPQDAADLASALVKHAREAARQSGQPVRVVL